MKKKVFFSIILLVCILIMIYYSKFHTTTEEAENVFDLPEEIETQIIDYSNDNTSILRDTYSLNELINSGKWVEKTLDELKDIPYDKKYTYWDIVKTNDKIEVMNHNSLTILNCGFKKTNVSDGFFIGVNRFELGGALYFYPDGDKSKKYKLKNGYIWDIYTINNNIYALATYPFLTPTNGKILKLEKSFGKWETVEFTGLEDVPLCYTFLNDNTMLLVTKSKLLELKNSKIDKIIIDNSLWQSLYPKSIIHENDVVYLGMMGGVMKIDLTSKETHFFTPTT